MQDPFRLQFRRAPWLVVAAIAVTTPGPSRAEAEEPTAQDKMVFCDTAAEVASAAASARDSGVAVADAKAMVADLMPPGAQREFLNGLIGLVYALDGVEAPVLREVATQMCHKQSGLK